jgi:hypothetical protein
MSMYKVCVIYHSVYEEDYQFHVWLIQVALWQPWLSIAGNKKKEDYQLKDEDVLNKKDCLIKPKNGYTPTIINKCVGCLNGVSVQRIQTYFCLPRVGMC